MAVRENLFRKKIGVCCDNEECGRIIKVVNNISELDKKLLCDICESLERDEYKFTTEDLEIVEFYQLIK